MIFKYLSSDLEYSIDNFEMTDNGDRVKVNGKLPLIKNIGFRIIDTVNGVERIFGRYTHIVEYNENYIIFEYVRPGSENDITIADLSAAIAELASLYAQLAMEV